MVGSTRGVAPVVALGIDVLFVMMPALAILGLALGIGVDLSSSLIAILAGSTTCAYVLDRARESWGLWSVGQWLVMVVVFLAAVFSLMVGAGLRPLVWGVIASLGLLTVGYATLQRWWWTKCLTVTLAWVGSLAFFPAAMAGAWTTDVIPLGIAGLLVCIGTLLYDFKDQEKDRAHGVSSFLVRFGPRQTQRFILVLLVVVGCVSALAQAWWWWPVCAAYAGLLFWQGMLSHRRWGPIVIDACLVLPAIRLMLPGL